MRVLGFLVVIVSLFGFVDELLVFTAFNTHSGPLAFAV